MPHSHTDLCRIAVDWLMRPASRSGPGCLTAVSETANAINGEIPDAIGWRPYRHNGCGSTLVEVKVSRADFLADAKKQHRTDGKHGMGVYRYFMAPVGLIAVDELPPQWGLVEVTERGHIKVRAGHVLMPNIRPNDADDPWRHAVFNIDAEMSMLVLALNRVGDPQRFQTMLRETGNRAAQAAKECERLRERNRELELQLFNLKHANDRKTAIPRRVAA